jgi:hypothetical protein
MNQRFTALTLCKASEGEGRVTEVQNAPHSARAPRHCSDQILPLSRYDQQVEPGVDPQEHLPNLPLSRGAAIVRRGCSWCNARPPDCRERTRVANQGQTRGGKIQQFRKGQSDPKFTRVNRAPVALLLAHVQ